MKKTVDNDLEHLLRTSADEIKLRPSPKVWKGINSRLQRRKRNYRAAVVLLLLIGLSAGVYTISNNKNNTAGGSVAGVQQNVPGNNNTAVPNTTVSFQGNEAVAEPASKPSLILATAQNNTTVNNNREDADTRPVSSRSNRAGTRQTPVNPGNPSLEDESRATASVENEPIIIKNEPGNNPAKNSAGEETAAGAETATGTEPATSFTKAQNNPEEIVPSGNNSNTEKLAAENISTAKTNAAKEKSISKPQELPVKDITDANIRITQKERRVTTEFYVVPSISYRKLSDSRNPDAPGAISKEDFDKAVYHKPSLGLEAGVSWHYRIYDRFRAKAGIQLNYNRFNMKATRAPQPEMARIVLYGNNQDVQNTSTLRTDDNQGGLVEWLRNKNLQVSIPIGFEVAVTAPSKGNTTLNIGATVQPSYLLGNKNYLLSTDIKNYTTEPSLVRRFNMNLGFETFFAFETKKLRWHMGPQLRYQLFSTYNKIYPFKENLIDYTFKVSVSKPF